ncbi:cytochrome P450 [Undibacterium crateris]|uniref:cytochrome P450 n=1 Tax=Undibacterium crateris TaxID=2528175 RepID=UPI0013894FF2|nr:cytochrome P450 [Undibacterium crateris]NDI85410.1 cytochrome P450 [Undibacterium crateris]
MQTDFLNPPIPHAIAAASHPAAPGYYRQLLEQPGIHYCPELRMWIAAHASDIMEIFNSPACAVRPPAEMVPAALGSGSTAQIFQQLIRMNEGQTHATGKRILQDCLQQLDGQRVQQTTEQVAHRLAAALAETQTPPASHPAQYKLSATAMNQLVRDLPLYVVAELSGCPEYLIPEIRSHIAAFVHALSKPGDAVAIAAANQAAQALLHTFTQLAESELAADSLLAQIHLKARKSGGMPAEAIIANCIGLLSQTYEASRGLLQASLMYSTHYPAVFLQVLQQPDLINDWVAEVCRLHSPVQNTRRYVTTATHIGNTYLPQDAVVLLLLAAANIDTAIHEQACEFRLQRPQRTLYSFGYGRHACPGQQLACQITATATRLAGTWSLALDQWQVSYENSANGRLPVWTHTKETA